MITHQTLSISQRNKGSHIITSDVLAQVKLPQQGVLHLFIQHTSAALSIQENASPEVCHDLDRALDRIVPENPLLYTHTEEGPDDMPAHIKSALCGSSVSIPIQDGKLMLGKWQGIYLLEFRNHAPSRNIVATLWS